MQLSQDVCEILHLLKIASDSILHGPMFSLQVLGQEDSLQSSRPIQGSVTFLGFIATFLFISHLADFIKSLSNL